MFQIQLARMNARWLLAAMLALPSLPAFAEGEAGDVAEGSRLRTTLQLGAVTSNNFYSQPDSEDEAFGAVFSPDLHYVFNVPRFRFHALGGADIARFEKLPGSEDNFEDYHLGAGLDWQSAARHRFAWKMLSEWDHDPFGTERTEGVRRSATGPLLTEVELDKWRRDSFSILYRYGLPSDLLGFELNLATQNKRYTNNRGTSTGTGTRFLDNERVALQFVTFLNLSPKTSALFDVIGARVRFEEVPPLNPNLAPDDPAQPQDHSANEMHYRVGLRWQATAKTEGDIRVGLYQRTPRDPRQDDFSALDWQAGVVWAPFQTHRFGLRTGRRTQESYLATVQFIDMRYYELEWAQEWNPSFSTGVTGSLVQADFVGFNRNDDIVTFGASAEYRANRSWTVLGNVVSSSRDSTISERDFDKLSSYLGVRFVR